MNDLTQQRNKLSTADLVAATEAPEARRAPAPDLEENVVEERQRRDAGEEPLAPLFSPDLADGFRAEWDAVQISFVDDPKQAVRKADELVAQVMKSLAESFANERTRIEGQADSTEQASTENLRVALRRYRSFFQRLLSL
jgi:hypothetical protein